MGVAICPKCGSIVQQTDTHCMDCGANIAEAERELVRREKQLRGGGPILSDQPTVSGAAAGVAEAGETSEKVRLKEFDKHLAEKLEKERAAVAVTAGIALIAGAVLMAMGFGALGRAGGVAALKALSYSDLRAQGLQAFSDPTVLAVLTILLGLAALLCAAGQIERFVVGNRAIAQVKRAERPDVVGISTLTWYGLVIASFVCPPVGILLGIILKFGQDEETRRLGGSMLISAVIALALIGVHLLWNAVGSFASQVGPAPAAPVG